MNTERVLVSESFEIAAYEGNPSVNAWDIYGWRVGRGSHSHVRVGLGCGSERSLTGMDYGAVDCGE